MPSTRKRTLTLPLNEFDRQILPASVRGGKPAVRHDAMSTFLRQQFRRLGGTIQKIEYTADEIQVTWIEDLTTADPINPIVRMLTQGDLSEAVILLKLLLSDDPDNTNILYNLGMACSDMGALDQAIRHLSHLEELEPEHVNGRIALGVALTRQGDYERAVVELERAIQADPSNPWAQRNLGACLGGLGRFEEAVTHLRAATGLGLNEDRVWYDLGQALERIGDDDAADAAYIRALEINEFGQVAELARTARTRIAHRAMRSTPMGDVRMDAVFYILSALEKFDAMTPEQVLEIASEIAMLGRKGLDINDPEAKYQLRSLAGEFSGMHLISIMYAAFQQIAPEQEVGIDLSQEYQSAQQLHLRRTRQE